MVVGQGVADGATAPGEEADGVATDDGDVSGLAGAAVPEPGLALGHANVEGEAMAAPDPAGEIAAGEHAVNSEATRTRSGTPRSARCGMPRVGRALAALGDVTSGRLARSARARGPGRAGAS